MFICPVCSKKFKEKEALVKHYLICWREHNPNHKPKDAPKSQDVEIRHMTDDTLSFFERK